MPVYMDYNATTPVDPRVAEIAHTFLKKDSFGNPSSFHFYGRAARKALSDAREQVARVLGCQAADLVFTGGGSEGDNHAIKGVFFANRHKGNHIITTAVEHPAVLGTCAYLAERFGARITTLGVDRQGRLDLDELKAALTPDTVLVSIMMANNETGVIFPIREIAELVHAKGVLLHTDAVQALGKIPVRIPELGVDLLSFAGHKIYAPKGIGALYIRPGLRLDNLQHGGHQENGLRAGTENMLGIVALGEALRIIGAEEGQEELRLAALRDRLENGLLARIPYLSVNGKEAPRGPNTSNITFTYVEGESLLLALDTVGIAVSSGSACATGSTEPSHVLLAMGLPPEEARATLRFSIGRFSSEADVDEVLAKLPPLVARLRELSPIYPGNQARG